jgi:hypothetical protein
MNLFKRRSKTSRLKGSDEANESKFSGPLGLSDLVTDETQNYGTAKDAKSAKADEAFRRNARFAISI